MHGTLRGLAACTCAAASRFRIRFLVLLAALPLLACTNFSPDARRHSADAMALAHGWRPLRLATHDFVLAAYAPSPARPGETLAVYIEGDGLAWLSPSRPSDDPTPLHPLALELALRHDRGTAVYLARPCQYVEAAERRGCEAAFWTDRRFADTVVAATSEAIDALKQRFQARRLVLVGYSGGGAVAALVAARRHDVVRLVTVAGNLAPRLWAQQHELAPLTGSLDPGDAWRALQDIPQLHLAGAEDTNVTPGLVAAFAARFPAGKRPPVQVVEGATHTCCWADKWPALLPQAVP